MLSATNISKRYPGVVALDDIAFEVRPGEVHALMGENGAGKSTLVKILTGAERADAGSIRLDGRSLVLTSPGDAQRAGIAVVHQEVPLAPNLSIAENLCIGARGMRRFGLLSQRRLRARAIDLLATFGVTCDVRAALADVSMATRQIVAIARALAPRDAGSHARVLILDEPTSSLDASEVDRLIHLVRGLRERGVAIVLVTHFLGQMERMSDRVTVLRNGRVAASWPLVDCSRGDVVRAMLGRDMGDETSVARSPSASDARVVVADARDLGRRRAIAPFSLSLRRGEVVGFAGLLGSGRTEALRLLAGVDRADSGERRVDGVVRRGLTRDVCLCPEDRRRDGQVGLLSVEENLLLGLQARRGWWRRIPRRDRRRLVAEAMQEFDVRASSSGVAIATLSGGNQQKTILARATLADPKALLLDEPTRGVDVGAKDAIRRIVRRLRERGLGVVFVSSEIEETVAESDRVIVFRDRAVVGELRDDERTVDRAIATIAEPHA